MLITFRPADCHLGRHYRLWTAVSSAEWGPCRPCLVQEYDQGPQWRGSTAGPVGQRTGVEVILPPVGDFQYVSARQVDGVNMIARLVRLAPDGPAAVALAEGEVD